MSPAPPPLLACWDVPESSCIVSSTSTCKFPPTLPSSMCSRRSRPHLHSCKSAPASIAPSNLRIPKTCSPHRKSSDLQNLASSRAQSRDLVFRCRPTQPNPSTHTSANRPTPPDTAPTAQAQRLNTFRVPSPDKVANISARESPRSAADTKHPAVGHAPPTHQSPAPYTAASHAPASHAPAECHNLPDAAAPCPSSAPAKSCRPP